MCINGSTNTVDTLQGVAYSFLFLLGLVVNAAVLCAFIAKRKSWTDTHIYMLNLALADFALILFLPFRIYDYFFCLPKTLLCTFLIYTHYINMYASMYTTTAISVHRYLAIRFPLQARSWRRKKVVAVAVCVIIWVFLVTMVVVFCEQNSTEHLWTCYERRKDHPMSLTVISLLVFVGFLIPLLIIVFCSSRIICILLKTPDNSEERKSIVGIVTANVIVFVVCYTPIHIAFLINYNQEVTENWESTSLPAHMFLLVCEWIASTNCCFDSISFYFLLKQFYS
ncbi:G-protein coupled receptor 35 [Odontesthes bonariensis]|uniref:G-protein coupled receptor 35 n=1 Tax=Odontesthes bonariensis TaxID=219752 RepID=UPI003F582462